MSEDVINRLIDLEAHFEYMKGGRKAKDHPELFKKFAKEHFWKPTLWALTDEECARYQAHERPPEGERLVVVEIEDVIRVTLPARLKTLGAKAKLEDLESMFLFQCKGFGSPSEVQALLENAGWTLSYDAMPGVAPALQALLAMGYETCAATPQIGDRNGNMWGKLKMWIFSKSLRTGPREVLNSVFIPNAAVEDGEDEQEVADKWWPSEVIEEDAEVPEGVNIKEEDRRLILGMRRAVIEEEKYMFKLAISRRQGLKKVTFISPSLRHIEVIGPMLRERGIEMRPILFGDYAWNQIKVDWSEPGAWMTYEERIASGAKLGDKYDLAGVERAKGWSDVVELLQGAG